MTKITIEEDLDFDKTHFKNIEELIDYLRSLNLIYDLQPKNMVNEGATVFTEKMKDTINENFELPQWQKDVIDKRLEDLEKNPNSFISYDEFLEKYGKI